MEERIEISILLDYYGNLLTGKQVDIMNLYYNEDLSLAEIAEINNISRQAIHDILRRCHKLLLEYESKLKLMQKDRIQNEVKELIIKKIDSLKLNISNLDTIKLIDDIKIDIKDNL